jgi:hypothetical protein
MDEHVSPRISLDQAESPTPERWKKHVLHVGPHSLQSDSEPLADDHSTKVEPWLAALLQSEFLGLLVGSGLTTAVARASGAPDLDMAMAKFGCEHEAAVNKAAAETARRCARGAPNLEDQIRAAGELIAGLGVLSQSEGEGNPGELPNKAARLKSEWQDSLSMQLKEFAVRVLDTERGVGAVLRSRDGRGDRVRRLLGSFLLTFASRAASRERLNLFTTNYDRVVEYGCDLLGLRMLDRFVGQMEPTFRASRLGVDMHYNPPGIRGEPRYLEGVLRLTKLHGSIDWRQTAGVVGSPDVVRCGLPFGAPAEHPAIDGDPGSALLIYPNPAKDVETLEYPYADLFRDFAAGTCQPNGVLFTYD